MNKRVLMSRTILACLILTLIWTSAAFAAQPSSDIIKRHYLRHKVFQNEAGLVRFGSRIAGSDVEKAAAGYIAKKMKKFGLAVEVQEFDTFYFEEMTPPLLEQISPNPVVYEEAVDFATMTFSGSGDVSALVQTVDLDMPPSGNSTSGCEPEDFSGFTPGNIALIQRGACTFAQKAENAAAAGATAAVIFNEGNAPDRMDVLAGTLGGPGISIPVVGTTHALGADIVAQLATDEVTLNLMVDTIVELRTSQNVIGTRAGKDPEAGIVYLGGHYDCVSAGPGANDNGSGIAAMLEAARVLKRNKFRTPATLKFIAFGAEETGLNGSEYYVTTNEEEITTMGLGMINLDMVGVGEMLQIGNIAYPEGGGSELTEYAQQKATEMGMTWESFEAGENSDHTFFEQAGLPAVFLTQRDDPNYHTAEDTIDKIQFDTLEANGELATAVMYDWANQETAALTTTPLLRDGTGVEFKNHHVYRDKVYFAE